MSPGLARAVSMAGMELPFFKAADLVGAVARAGVISVSGLARATRVVGARAKTRLIGNVAPPMPGCWSNCRSRSWG